jgi:hypothetical protein
MSIYNIFGDFIKVEKFTENIPEVQSNNIQSNNMQSNNIDLTDYNVYSHLVFSSPNNKIRLTLYPLYYGNKAHFNLSIKGDKEIKYNVIKSSADSSYINNPLHIGKLLVDGKELDRNLFKSFRIYDGKLQMIDNGNNVNLSFDSETKKITNKDVPHKLHLFDFSPSGSQVNIFNNDPEASFYKVNKTRNTFYLTTDREMKEFVTTIRGTTNNKDEASIFTFKEIDPAQPVRNPTRIDIPEEDKDGSGYVRNRDIINQRRSIRLSFSKSFKYNLLELAKNVEGDMEKVKIKLVKDEIRGTVVFVPLKKEEDTKNYQLHVWIKEN